MHSSHCEVERTELPAMQHMTCDAVQWVQDRLDVEANKPKRRKLSRYPVTAEEMRKSTQTCMKKGLICSYSDVFEACEVSAKNFKAAEAHHQGRDVCDGNALPTINTRR
eukprot:893468-Amphidinium_carterae.1